MHVWTHHRCRFPLPPKHRFPVDKYARLAERVLADGLAAPDEVHEPAAIGWDALAAVHDADLLAPHPRRRPEPARGARPGPALVAAARRAGRRTTAGTLHAARHALRHGVGMNLGGGTHHAGRAFARGYCLFNDVAVALARPAARGPRGRAVVVDCDVHQGDGTADVFAGDAATFTLSLHGARNYPFTRIPSDLDVDLPSGTGDAAYLRALEEALDTALPPRGRRRRLLPRRRRPVGGRPARPPRAHQGGAAGARRARPRPPAGHRRRGLRRAGRRLRRGRRGHRRHQRRDRRRRRRARPAGAGGRDVASLYPCSAPGGVVLMGTRGLCTAELGVRFPSPPSPTRRRRQRAWWYRCTTAWPLPRASSRRLTGNAQAPAIRSATARLPRTAGRPVRRRWRPG